MIKKLSFLFCFLSLAISSFAKTEPVEGIEPSGTLPVLYINTENSKPVDQKENYIDAEYWLECSSTSDFEDIGSKESPLKLGIKGRGNTSWRHDGQKPYKLKLDKKADLLGMGKNKHWALLARLTFYHLFNEVLAFELGRKLDMPFVPEVRPVEVVLNGTYIGLYMLTETVRIDDNRLEIAEQPEGNEDLETIGDGWLVEMDNNDDEFQIRVPQPQGYDLRITHKTPEVTSKAQDDWLYDQFEQITTSINSQNKLENNWEKLIDVESLAKHLIVEECLQNYDGYLGSCYMHKDSGGKWCFGPLWDFSASWVYKDEMLAERPEQHLIGEFFKFPSLRKEARRIWNEYIEETGNDWVEPFLFDFYKQIKEAVEQSVKVWPDTPLDAEKGWNWMRDTFLHNSRYNTSYFNENCITHDIKVRLIDNENPDSQNAESSFSVSMNEISRSEGVVSKGDNVEVIITPIGANKYFCVNDNKIMIATGKENDVIINLENIEEDHIITLTYSDFPIEDNTLVIQSPVDNGIIPDYRYYNLNGVLINIENASPGIYIRSDGQKFMKIKK